MKPNETLDAQGSITWDRPMLERFKVVYSDMKALKVKEFTFDGHEFVTDYAKHLIDYLHGQFYTQ